MPRWNLVFRKTAPESVLIRVHPWFCLLLLLPMQVGAESNAVRFVAPSAESRQLELPREAVVVERDDTGKQWQLSGTVPTSMTVARKDFEVCLNRQGWKLLHTTPTSIPGQRSELSTWTKGERRLLLMLTETEGRQSVFCIGET